MLVLKGAGLWGARGFNYRLGREGGGQIKQLELNGLLADKMKERDNEDWRRSLGEAPISACEEGSAKEKEREGESTKIKVGK